MESRHSYGCTTAVKNIVLDSWVLGEFLEHSTGDIDGFKVSSALHVIVCEAISNSRISLAVYFPGHSIVFTSTSEVLLLLKDDAKELMCTRRRLVQCQALSAVLFSII